MMELALIYLLLGVVFGPLASQSDGGSYWSGLTGGLLWPLWLIARLWRFIFTGT